MSTLNWGRGLFALAALVAVAVFSTPEVFVKQAQAQSSGAVIRSIDVQGNRRIEDESVRSYMKISPGQRYNARLVDESLKALFTTGLFSDVTIRRRGSSLVVKVVENPIINRVAFEGNRKLKDKDLKAVIEMRPRTVFTRAKVQSDVRRITEQYRRTGRFTAHVEPKVIRRPQDRVDLVYEISEGPETNVVNINFIGNTKFSDRRLRSVISTSEYSWWNFLSNSDRYDPDRLNFDRELLRRHYIKKGYADFRVISAVAELDRDQKNFLVTFTVEEGEHYDFGEVELDSGISELDPEVLRNEVTTRQGRSYDASKVDKTVEGITLEAGRKGFAFAQVRPRIEKNLETKTINLTYVIDEGPRVYIERINVRGNVRTLDRVVRREFRLAEGDAYNRTLVDKARKNLLGLNFFKKVDITTELGSASDKIIINVDVEEKSTGELSLGVGYSTTDAVVGDISLTERNLMGRGQYLRLSTSLSIKRQQLDLRFTEPHFLGRNLSFGVDVFGTSTDLTGSSGYKSRQVGAGLRFGFPIMEDLFLNTRYSLTRDKIYDVDTVTASAAIIAAQGQAWVSQIGYTLTFDKLDNPLSPTEGYKLVFDQDLAGLGGDVFYLRTVAKAVVYENIFEDIIGSLRGSAGHIQGWNNKAIRISDAFRKGGDSIRGFEESGIGPRLVGGESVGGKTFAIVNAEVEFPLGLPKKFGIRGAVFADAGTLFNAPVFAGTKDKALRASVGASILWTSPIGPLRFDFAKALKKQSHDKTRFFNFSAGMRF